MEHWADIVGYQGYQVSDKGRVRTFNKVTSSARFEKRHWENRILKQKISRLDGRARVCIWADGKEHTFLVHRLEAIAFLGEPSNSKMTVNHKDGNPLNNAIDNLEWMTVKENIQHGFENGLYPNQKRCVLVDENGEEYSFISQSRASRWLGRSNSYINMCSRFGRQVRCKDGKTYKIKILTT